MKVESESEVAQSCPTLCDPMDCIPLGSSIHGIFQAEVLEWGAIAFSGWSYNLLTNSLIPLHFDDSFYSIRNNLLISDYNTIVTKILFLNQLVLFITENLTEAENFCRA